MCGIHLLIDKLGQLDVTPIQKMINATTHRGPDDFGFEVFESNAITYYLGANRLKITDLSNASHQPMHSTDRMSALVFNGEIYNYQDLKNEQLQKGVRFMSPSDTEVVLNLLDMEKEKGFSKLQGMFAVIHVNNSEQTLRIGRDNHGMKPLYYYHDDNFFIASSEIRGILASGLVKKELNDTAVHQYLQYKYVQKPATFFQGIFEVLPGSIITVDKELSIRENPIEYKSDEVQIYPDLEDEKKVILNTEKLLTSAVIKHIPQNQTSGLFLSGGVDSTLILALLDQSGFRNFPTYSFVASDEDRKHGTEDYKYSRQAAKIFGSHHHEIKTSADEVISLLDDFIDKTDQPVADSAALMTFMLSEKVSREHKVVFSGAGADELFAGYNRHQAFHLYLKNHKLLKFMKQAGGMSASMFAAMGNESGRMINKFFHDLDDNPGITFHNFITFDGLVPKPEIPLWKEESEGDFMNYHLGQALKHDLENYLVSDVLVVNDKMAMQSGIEMRMPYLDHDVGNFLKSLPPSYLMKHGKKWILRRILEQKNGKPFVKRSKQGFGLPFGGWIDTKNDSLWSFTRDKNLILYKFVEKEIIDRMLFNHRNKKANYTTELWGILVLGKWLERNFS